MISNRDIAAALEGLARLLEIDEASPFRIRAYRNAADSIRFFDPPLAGMLQSGADLTELQDIGTGIAKSITQIVSAGPASFFEQAGVADAEGLLELLAVPGLGPKKVRTLRDTLDVRSIPALREALERGRLDDVPGFGEKIVARLRKRLAPDGAGEA